MPFTPAHPALILPLVKNNRHVSVTALVAGSITPDFEFFFQMKEVENIGHHWYGFFLFDMPVALAFCWLFHNLLRNLLLANMPVWYYNRFKDTACFNWNQYALSNMVTILLSVATGVITHLFWDAFTHYDGWFVLHWPLLSKKLLLGNVEITVFFLLQIFFSIAGIMAVIYAVAKMPVKTVENDLNAKNNFFWPVLFLMITAILAIRIYYWPQYNSFWGIFMAAMGAITYSAAGTALFFKIFSFQKKLSI
jgi:Domain of unknown function (DUF4184)